MKKYVEVDPINFKVGQKFKRLRYKSANSDIRLKYVCVHWISDLSGNLSLSSDDKVSESETTIDYRVEGGKFLIPTSENKEFIKLLRDNNLGIKIIRHSSEYNIRFVDKSDNVLYSAITHEGVPLEITSRGSLYGSVPTFEIPIKDEP